LPSGQHSPGVANRPPGIKVLDILIAETNAAGGHEAADGRWLIGAVDAVYGITEIHRTRAEWIGFTASHESRQIGLACDHLLRRKPVRPFFHSADALGARPSEAFATDTNAVTDRLAVVERQVKVGVRRIDNDSAGWLNSRVIDDRAVELRLELYRWGPHGRICWGQSSDCSAAILWRGRRRG